MQVKSNTIKTYDLLGISQAQYDAIQPYLKALANTPASTPNGNGRSYAKSIIAKAAKRASKQVAKSVAHPKNRPVKGEKVAVIKTVKTANTMKCPVGGETIRSQGAWNHIRKHGREKGMTAEEMQKMIDEMRK